MDLNRVRDKLKKQKPLGVTRDGKITEDNPRNDGSKEDKQGHTTLLPQKHFVA